MKRGATHQQNGEGDSDSQNQSEADDEAAAESHGEDKYQDDNQDRFYQVDHKGTDGFIHFVGLEEYLFHFHSYGNLWHDFCQPFFNRFSHIGDNGIFFHGQADGQGRFSVHEETVPLRLTIGTFYLCNISQSDGFSLWGTNKQVTDVFLISNGTAHMQWQPVALILVTASVDGFSGILQAHHDLGRDNAITGNLLFR